MIETVPKKGYILHAVVTEALNTKKTKLQKVRKPKNKLVYFALVLAIVFLLVLLFFKMGQNTSSTA